MLAARMIRHWTAIAQSHEITGTAILPLLEQELAWYRDNDYMKCYDETVALIREIRSIETKKWDGKDKSRGVDS